MPEDEPQIALVYSEKHGGYVNPESIVAAEQHPENDEIVVKSYLLVFNERTYQFEPAPRFP